jgi:hypothetical protein
MDNTMVTAIRPIHLLSFSEISRQRDAAFLLRKLDISIDEKNFLFPTIAMGTTLTRTDIINRFNAIMGPIVATYPPVWHKANIPTGGSNIPLNAKSEDDNSNGVVGDLGPVTEPTFTAADLPDLATGESAITRTFYVLHHLAMRLTRIRMAQNWFVNGSNLSLFQTQRSALKLGLELYFDIPAVPALGSNITDVDITNFINALGAEVTARRTDPKYQMILTSFSCHSSCHGSCHSNCHGSRGRR